MMKANSIAALANRLRDNVYELKHFISVFHLRVIRFITVVYAVRNIIIILLRIPTTMIIIYIM